MRKLYRMLFSRYFISAMVILAELALIFYLVLVAYDYSLAALGIITAVNVAIVVSLINRAANPEYKVSWLVVVMLIPPFGAVLYAMFYSRRVSAKEAGVMREIQDNLDGFSDTGEGISQERDTEFAMLRREDSLAAGKAHAILNDDRLARVYTRSSSEFFELGEDMYERMLLDIASAEKYIFLQYFIIEDGEMWQNIHSLLLKKVGEGVEVRVMYDDIGCMKTLPSRYNRRLAAEGIRCIRFAPVTPRISTAHNNRNHRKILIVDGRIAYTGGINIADEYINKRNRFGHWKDGGVRIVGDAAIGLLKLFITSWDLSVNKITDFSEYMPDKDLENESDGGYYIPFGSGPAPIYNRPVGKNALLNIINQAQKYVYITTPYLIVDYDLTESLRNAALRGVDVRIITPGRADKKMVKVMTKSSYPYLIEAGVGIYEYQPGFIHEKSIVSDDLYAVVGTINLDYRSLVHHYENAVWIYSSPTVVNIRDGFMKTVSVSERKNMKEVRLTPFEWIVRNIMRIFAPLL